MTADLRQIVEGVLLVFAALFPVVNPLGGAPIFLVMTPDYDPVERTAANPAGMRSVGCTPHTAMA
jgi:small neutral amino acid transporter SnatA (MarC family)